MQIDDQPVVRTIVTPQDTNLSGSVFGGWLLGLMDQAAAVTGVALSGGPVVTAAVREVSFDAAVGAGEVISIYGHEVERGQSSLQIGLEVFAEDPADGRSRRQAAAGLFVIVAVDGAGRPRNAGLAQG